MGKYIQRVKSNLFEAEANEDGMEVVQAVLLIIVGIFVVGGIFMLVKWLMASSSNTIKEQTTKFNEWANEDGGSTFSG